MKKKEFISKEYWETRYRNGGNSGAGSYNHLAQFKANVINDFITKYNIDNVLELGCGHGNNLSMYKINNYVWMDVSPTAIKICKKRFDNDTFNINDNCLYDNRTMLQT